MKIRVEVEVGPTELREFLGLPDVTGIQQEALEAVSRKLKRGSPGADPVAVLRGFMPSGLLSMEELQRLLLKALEAGESVTVKRSASRAKAKAKTRSKGRKKATSRK